MTSRARGEGATIHDLRRALRALRSLPRELTDELRDASTEIAQDVAAAATGDASTRPEQLIAGTIRTRRDRIPKVAIGGSRRVGSRGVPAGSILMGVTFGGQGRPTTQQFRPHLGRRGYLLFPTVRRLGPAMGRRWLDALETVIEGAAREGSV